MGVRNGASGLYDEPYSVNNIVDGEPLYIGKVTPSGRWLLQQYTTATGAMLYANVSNNAGVASYNSAWTNRLTLSYSNFETLTGV